MYSYIKYSYLILVFLKLEFLHRKITELTFSDLSGSLKVNEI